VCATQTLREDAGGKKSVGGARDRDNGELRFSLRSIQVRQTDVAFCDEMMPFYLFIRPFLGCDAVLFIFTTKPTTFCQDRLGTNIGNRLPLT
jgi:hypothetical protein